MDFGTFETATIALTVFLLGIFQRYPQNKITVVSAGVSKVLESIGEVKYISDKCAMFQPASYTLQRLLNKSVSYVQNTTAVMLKWSIPFMWQA